MDRRGFLAQMAAVAVPLHAYPSARGKTSYAITMDDPHTQATPRLTAAERNRAILDALSEGGARAALFVCGMRVDDAAGRRLLETWNSRGHVLGNHSYSHFYLHSDDVSAADFTHDIERGEEVVRGFSRFRRLFRFPLLKEGSSSEERDAVRAFLVEGGYRPGYVTIDTSDWYIEQRMLARLETDPDADLGPYRDFYLQHMWERARYYDDLAFAVVERPVSHTLLMHHNLLNALFLGDLIRMFATQSWELVDVDAAFEDPIFRAQPDIVPAGESIVWALAKESGGFDPLLRYPGEDGVYEREAMDELGL